MVADGVKRVLDSNADVRLAVVFGSIARGRPHRGSDIDIGIAMSSEAEIPTSLRVALDRASGREVSVTLLNGAPPLLRFEIARNGKVLLERERGAWVRFRAQAMVDWWDWAETARMMHRTMARRLREEAQRGPA